VASAGTQRAESAAPGPRGGAAGRMVPRARGARCLQCARGRPGTRPSPASSGGRSAPSVPRGGETRARAELLLPSRAERQELPQVAKPLRSAPLAASCSSGARCRVPSGAAAPSPAHLGARTWSPPAPCREGLGRGCRTCARPKGAAHRLTCAQRRGRCRAAFTRQRDNREVPGTFSSHRENPETGLTWRRLL
jgi:hypothetical protein